MAPIKFEEDIKQVVEKRRMEPSSKSWTQLDLMLQSDENKNKKKGFWCFGVAASIVGILFVSISFFNSDTKIVEPIIVDVKENVLPSVLEEKQEEVIVAQVEEVQEVIPSEKEKTIQNQPEKLSSLEIYTAKELESDEIVIASVPVEPQKESSTLEEQEIENVASQIAVLSEENSTVTDEEIDKLLMAAQRKIALEKFKGDEIAVSAHLLLLEVEEEIDPSFRAKVFDILKDNYHSVKNAVAQRND